MSNKTRYFVAVTGAILVIGLGTGIVASYMGLPVSVFTSAAGPEELEYVPADAAVVAYANVRDVMNSQLRQRFREMEPTPGAPERVRREDRPQLRRRHRHRGRGHDAEDQPGRATRKARS